MAIEVGSASNYQDLLAKLITFLTTNASLVGSQQNWTNVRTEVNGGLNDHLIRGPGLASTDQIHVRLAAVSASGNVGLSCWGFTGYNSSLTNANQPGISPSCGIPLWTNTINYWFLANGRRFMVIAKVATQYFSMYAGFFLPYTTPAEYAYPMFIGASAPTGTTYPYTETSYNVSGFWNPSASSVHVRTPAGTWVGIQNVNSSGQWSSVTNGIWPNFSNNGLAANPLVGNPEWPAIICVAGFPPLGALDGVFISQLTTVAAEDTDTVGSTTRLIVPSVYRADKYSYGIISLE